MGRVTWVSNREGGQNSEETGRKRQKVLDTPHLNADITCIAESFPPEKNRKQQEGFSREGKEFLACSGEVEPVPIGFSRFVANELRKGLS